MALIRPQVSGQAPGTLLVYYDERTGKFTFVEGQEAFTGWECQPL